VNREEKVQAVAALHDLFQHATVTLLATSKGLSVGKVQQLRRALKQAGGEYKVAKNTFARLAVKETAYGSLEQLLQGPTGLVFGYSDPVAVAKILVRFAEESNDALTIKGGALDGQPVVAEQIKALATMPPVEALRARVVAMARAPGARLVAAAKCPATRIAGAIAALVKRKQEETGSPTVPAGEPANTETTV
jgi:large subunit ribosomal protein L10